MAHLLHGDASPGGGGERSHFRRRPREFVQEVFFAFSFFNLCDEGSGSTTSRQGMRIHALSPSSR